MNTSSVDIRSRELVAVAAPGTLAAPSRAVDRRWASVLPALVLAGVAVVYLATLAVNHTEAEDSIVYVREVTGGKLRELFHPNHLLFNSLHWLIYQVWQALGYRGTAELPMEIDNLVAGLMSLGLMLRLQRRLGIESRLSILTTLATAFTFGFWWYAVEAETYVLPIPMILLAIDRTMTIAEDPRPLRHYVVLGLLCAGAALLHEQHALVSFALGSAVLVTALRRRREGESGPLLRGLVVCAALVAALVGAAYVIVGVGVQGEQTLAGVAQWSKGHAANGLWAPWSSLSPIKSVVGLARSFSGLHLLFASDSFYHGVTRMFPGKILLEERYLVQGASLARRVSHVALLASTLTSGAVLVMRMARRGGEPAPAQRSPARPGVAVFKLSAWLMLIAYAAFNTAWEPTNIEFWIVLLPILHLVVALRLDAVASGATTRWVLLTYVAALGLSNLLGSVLPQTTSRNDYWYQMNLPLIQQAKRGDVIFTDGGYVSDAYLRFYTEAEVIVASEGDPARMRRAIAPRGGRVFVSSWLWSPVKEIVAAHMGLHDEKITASLLDPYRAGWREVGRSENQVIYEIFGDSRPPLETVVSSR